MIKSNYYKSNLSQITNKFESSEIKLQVFKKLFGKMKILSNRTAYL